MRRTVPLLLGLGSLFLGVCLPYCPLPNGLRLTNLFWSSIDGLGLWAIDLTLGLSIQSRLLIFGVFVWPIAVAILMFILGLRLVYTKHFRIRWLVILALVATTLVTTDLDRTLQPPLSELPTYHRLFGAVW